MNGTYSLRSSEVHIVTKKRAPRREIDLNTCLDGSKTSPFPHTLLAALTNSLFYVHDFPSIYHANNTLFTYFSSRSIYSPAFHYIKELPISSRKATYI